LTVKFAGVDEMKSITISGDVVAANEVAPAEVAPVLVKAPEQAKPAPAVDVIATPAVAGKATKKVKKVKKAANSK
jgi:hypothetical protein